MTGLKVWGNFILFWCLNFECDAELMVVEYLHEEDELSCIFLDWI